MKDISRWRFTWVIWWCVIIVMALFGIVIYLREETRQPREKATQKSIVAIQTAVGMYVEANGTVPDRIEHLMGDHPHGPRLLYDAWGTPFRYTKIDEGTFEVRSAGPDEVMDTKDDITN